MKKEMEVRDLIQRIKILHHEIEEECNERLKVLEECSERGEECRECSLEDRCRMDMSKMVKISQLYHELNSRKS